MSQLVLAVRQPGDPIAERVHLLELIARQHDLPDFAGALEAARTELVAGPVQAVRLLRTVVPLDHVIAAGEPFATTASTTTRSVEAARPEPSTPARMLTCSS